MPGRPRRGLVPRRVAGFGLLLGLGLAPAAGASPDPGDPPPREPPPITRERIRALEAGPDGPRFALEAEPDGTVTARFGVMIPVWTDEDDRGGAYIAVLPMAELAGPLIPYESWRGRLAAEAGWARSLVIGGRPARLTLGGGLMHESDHLTAVATVEQARAAVRYPVVDGDGPVAVVMNEVFGRAGLRSPVGGWSMSTAAVAHLHVLTCTEPLSRCGSGTEGSRALGGTLHAGLLRLRPALGGFAPFVSLMGTGHLASGLARAEWRLAARAGLVELDPTIGAWLVSVEASLGHPVGVRRGLDDDDRRLALALSWSL